MRSFRPLLVILFSFICSYVGAQDPRFDSVPKEKHDYQSDVARLRKIVINSLYSHKEIFLRELISNANDALEKLRLTALTDKNVDGAGPLNITIRIFKNENGPGGRLIISDTGIGMTPEELTSNLGTLAKSGTTDFLARAESQDASGTGNLIGAFGLGFYSSFLVADQVYVASIAAKTADNPNPPQYIFSSSADESSFEVFPDPRGDTLGRGTEITLILKNDSLEYLDTSTLQMLVNKHSVFSSAFPIYLFTQRTEEVDEDTVEDSVKMSSESVASGDSTPPTKYPDNTSQADDADDAVIVEEVIEDSGKTEDVSPPKKKSIVVDEWLHLNSQPPLWMRDPKNVTNEEYSMLYQATFKDLREPLTWSHFSLTTESGIAVQAILYVPSTLSENFWQQPLEKSTDVRLMVKHVFITSDFGEDALPKWVSWVKAVVNADDLPLHVSRETLQSTVFLRQVKQAIIKRLILLLTRISEEDSEKYSEFIKSYGTTLKLGAVEDAKNRAKLTALIRFNTNHRNETSLDSYLENKKQGQKQIFYLAEAGKPIDELANSVFIEKLHARGYEVLLLNEPLDEVVIQKVQKWKNFPFQDAAKAGLEFGDEVSAAEEEKEQLKALTEKFKPLLDWLTSEASEVVRNVIISNRLVTSPCAVVAEFGGFTANIEKLMSAANNQEQGFMHEFAKKQKVLEINPRSPLIEGLLRRVEQLPSEEDERDIEAEDELKEVASILIDGALVRSGFGVPDSNKFFTRVDRVLRRSLGVSETASTDTTVKPAPPVDPELLEEVVSQENAQEEFGDIQEGQRLVVEHDEL